MKHWLLAPLSLAFVPASHRRCHVPARVLNRRTMVHRDEETLLGNQRSVENHDTVPPMTTGQKILDLAVPAAGALLIDPLMTLADTAFVGKFTTDGAAPLAGMGSAAALLTFSFYLFNFLCTATTPLVAEKRAAGFDYQAQVLGGQVLSLALMLGVALTAILFSLQQPLLNIMGTDSTGPDANAYALAFLSIRAFAAPAVLCIDASVGVLRGYLDTKTPIFVLIFANAVNLLLDLILIVWAGLGPMGAAIATTTAEWISAGLFLSVLAGRLPTVATKTEKSLSVVPAFSIPSFSELRPLLVASSSVFFRTLVLQLSLSTAAALAARSGGTDQLAAASSIAAHQIGIQLWIICSFFCDSLAAASQGLIADALGRNNSDDVLDVSKTIFMYSLVLGLFLGLLLQTGASTGLLFGLFTNDASTIASLTSILPLIVVAQPLNAVVFAADGILQGASEFPFQAKAMVLSGVIAALTYVAFDLFGTSTETLQHVWLALMSLQLMRGLTSLWKLVDGDGPINLLSLSKP